MQSAVVVTAFSRETIAGALSFLQHVSPWAHDLAERVLTQQAAAFDGSYSEASHVSSSIKHGSASSSSLSLVGSVWNACVSIMLFYFVISTLETFAQSYLAEVRSWSWKLKEPESKKH
ncbi:hypothetical protein IWW50_002301 [Coemansia erecta]|nr:hypothetical protein GGF43_001830 [Coemansia sp. RSA 2618]KAJ2826555.1 hypothetical protein IWW50_002301 [Coemansia erecta]